MSGSPGDKKPEPSGRVRHDPGGRAVWEWAIDSGRQALDSTSRLLQRLDLSGLRLMSEDDKSWEKKAGEVDAPGTAPGTRQPDPPPEARLSVGGASGSDPAGGKGFNPYDSRTPTGRGAARPAAPAKPAGPRITQPVRPAPKPGLFAKIFGKR